ncbi:MAG: biopolymer transporter ExbD [Bacteroidales bacterium]
MARKKVPEINGGPMADIAFLLLIFFLVATTMDVDTGITRKMPPLPEDQEQQDDEKRIKERNIFTVLINSNDRLLVEGEPMQIQNLRDAAKEFIANPQDKSDLPEKEVKDIPHFGEREVPKNAVISLKNDRETSYKMYIKVQNELVAAYKELRNELANQEFGEDYEDLDKDKEDAIREIYPQVISEAEPVNVGGN